MIEGGPHTSDEGSDREQRPSESHGRVGSLRQKLTRLILGQLIVLAVGGALVMAYRSAGEYAARRARVEEELSHALLSKARLLVDNQRIAFRPLIDDYALTTMYELVHGTVRADPDILYGLLTDDRGRVLAFAKARAFVSDLPTGEGLSKGDAARVLSGLRLPTQDASARGDGETRTREFHGWGHELLEVSAPVRSETGGKLGVVRYGFSKRRLSAALAEFTARQTEAFWAGLGLIALVSAAALLFGTWLSLRASRRIIEPVQNLTAAATQLARGDRSVRVQIASGDELQMLGEAFNRMVMELSESYSQLERSNAKLLAEMATREQAEQQRREAEHQLAQAQKMEAIGQLAGGVAHDFNNLLTVIQGHAALMDLYVADANEATGHKLGEHLGGIQTASTRAANLTRQLLAFSRRDQDNPQVVQLAAVVSGIEPMLRRLLREDIRLSVEAEPDQGHLRADPSRIEQVILNLAINAGDAMPDGGQLTIRADQLDLDAPRALYQGELSPGSYTRLSVVDTGTGIAPEHLEHLFEPFFTTKAVGKGTGLGLAMVHGIVRAAGGLIDVTSEPQAGTTFTLYFPSVAGDSAAVESRRDGTTPRGHGELVLLCEDDDAVRAITETFLEQHGYAVASFGTPRRALGYAQQHGRQIDVLVTDVVMPEMSGPELAEQIGAYALAPAIYLSGYTAGALEPYGLEEGSASLLRKPFTRQELCALVHHALQWKAARSA